MATRLALDFCSGASDLLSSPVQTRHQSHSRHRLTGAESLRDPPMGTGSCEIATRQEMPMGGRGISSLGGSLAPGSPARPWELEAELPRLRGCPELPAPLSRLGLRVLLQPFLAQALGQLLLYLRAGLS